MLMHALPMFATRSTLCDFIILKLHVIEKNKTEAASHQQLLEINNFLVAAAARLAQSVQRVILRYNYKYCIS